MAGYVARLVCFLLSTFSSLHTAAAGRGVENIRRDDVRVDDVDMMT